MKKQFTLKFTISTAILLAMLFYASYAAINSPIVKVSNGTLTGSVGTKPVFTATGTGVSDITVSFENMASFDDAKQDKKVVATSTSEISMSITSDNVEGVKCNYDLVWEWQSGVDNYKKSYAADGSCDGHEYEVNIYCGNGVTSKNYTSATASDSVQVPDYGSTDNTIFSSSAKSAAVLNTDSSYKCVIITNFYNIKTCNQTLLKDHTYSGKVKVANVSCSRA